MNWNLFWGLFVGGFAVVLWFVSYFYGIRKKYKKDRCVTHTIGKVIRYSSINYNGIHLPLVSYYVNGREYRIAGPKFKGSKVSSITTPSENIVTEIESNLTTREDLPDVLIVKFRRNSFISVQNSPLKTLYPVGSEVDVYYNPKKPKDAFVQRFEGYNAVLAIIFICLAIILSLAAVFLLFGAKIVMQ